MLINRPRAVEGHPIDVYAIDADTALAGARPRWSVVIRRRDDEGDEPAARVGSADCSAGEIAACTRSAERFLDS